MNKCTLKILLVLFFMCLFSANAANASKAGKHTCDMDKLAFGSNANAIAQKFDLDSLEVNSGNHATAVKRGEVLCFGLPEGSIAKFTFLYDKFVQFEVEYMKDDGELFKVMEENFGEPAKKPNHANPGQDNFQLLWDNEKRTALYSSQQRYSGEFMEYIQISSKKHKDLFSKIAKEEDE